MAAGAATTPSQVVGLDLLRLAAALLVTVYHLTYLEWANPHQHGTAAAAPFLAYVSWTPWVDTGWVGVQIFFVISGFVIAYTANGRSPSAFVRSRILRLLPGIWICASLSLIPLLLTGTPLGETLKLYLLSLVIFPAGPWVAGSYWTLPVEIAFYSLMFLVLCRNRFDRLERVVLMLGGISLALWVAVLAVPDGRAGDVVTRLATHRVPKQLLLQHGCFFALGAMIWIVRQKGLTAQRLAALALFAGAGMVQIANEAHHAGEWAGVPMRAAPAELAFLLALAFIVLSLRWNATAHRRLGRRVATIRAMGLMTYPVYLLHQPVGIALSAWQLRAGVPPVLALLLSLAVVVALSWLVAMRIEPRLREWMKPRLEAVDRRIPPRWEWAGRPTRPLSPSGAA
ncbi:acyltransferase family protein [Sphingomonas desiccabilis]|uniref:Acyltransferase n=1 Tax=Sphingomonas desiccabilis TaxID=429134 RepID=A0A4Q2ITE4_9SPHN|nr:acyltransferase [Sphingomonas desiccabilis]MBB3911836.1 peptidoglycan/LPS O-acetylase OafA/YrhL [Sphingomonas desiccabilis]RXZ31449.1 acyltransferase [Sphingomonas desiccabilis]